MTSNYETVFEAYSHYMKQRKAEIEALDIEIKEDQERHDAAAAAAKTALAAGDRTRYLAEKDIERETATALEYAKQRRQTLEMGQTTPDGERCAEMLKYEYDQIHKQACADIEKTIAKLVERVGGYLADIDVLQSAYGLVERFMCGKDSLYVPLSYPIELKKLREYAENVRSVSINYCNVNGYPFRGVHELISEKQKQQAEAERQKWQDAL